MSLSGKHETHQSVYLKKKNRGKAMFNSIYIYVVNILGIHISICMPNIELNHRITGMGQMGRDDSGSPCLTSLHKLGHPRTHGTELHPDGSGLSPVRVAPHPL